MSAAPGQTQHIVLGFTVSLLSVENPNINDASLDLSGVSILPGGSITDMESLTLAALAGGWAMTRTTERAANDRSDPAHADQCPVLDGENSVIAAHNRRAIAEAIEDGFLINLSGNNPTHADQLAALHLGRS